MPDVEAWSGGRRSESSRADVGSNSSRNWNYGYPGNPTSGTSTLGSSEFEPDDERLGAGAGTPSGAGWRRSLRGGGRGAAPDRWSHA